MYVGVCSIFHVVCKAAQLRHNAVVYSRAFTNPTKGRGQVVLTAGAAVFPPFDLG